MNEVIESEECDLRIPWKTKDLIGADPDCEHDVVDAPGGGVICTKCDGWFCF